MPVAKHVTQTLGDLLTQTGVRAVLGQAAIRLGLWLAHAPTGGVKTMNGAIWTVPKSATSSGLDWLGAAAGSARGAAEGTDASSAGLTRSDTHARVAASPELLLPGGPGSRLPARPQPSGPTCVG